MLFLHSIIFFCGMQKQKDRLIFMKNVINHVWHIVSSVAPKLNLIETVLFSTLIENLDFFSIIRTQGSHMLEKYLNLEGFLERSLKIISSLKSTRQSLKSLENFLNSTIFCRT